MAPAALHVIVSSPVCVGNFVKFRRASTLTRQISLERSFSPPQHTGWSAGPSPWGCCSLVLSAGPIL